MKATLILLMLKLTHLHHPTADRLKFFTDLAEDNQVMGKTFDVDPILLTVVEFRKSGLKKMAVSDDHKDVGVMQIRVNGAAEGTTYLRKQMFNPWVNTYLGTKYLRTKIDQCGGLTRGLSAYNKGHCTRDLSYGQHTMALYRKIVREHNAVAMRN